MTLTISHWAAFFVASSGDVVVDGNVPVPRRVTRCQAVSVDRRWMRSTHDAADVDEGSVGSVDGLICKISKNAFTLLRHLRAIDSNLCKSDQIQLIHISFDSPHQKLSLKLKNTAIRFLAIKLWPKSLKFSYFLTCSQFFGHNFMARHRIFILLSSFES